MNNTLDDAGCMRALQGASNRLLAALRSRHNKSCTRFGNGKFNQTCRPSRAPTATQPPTTLAFFFVLASLASSPQVLWAQNGGGTPAPANSSGRARAPYSMVYFTAGGGLFSPQHSSATAPVQPCPGGVITNVQKACAEQFSQTGTGLIEMGYRLFDTFRPERPLGSLVTSMAISSLRSPINA
jgi:hypothetical protein